MSLDDHHTLQAASGHAADATPGMAIHIHTAEALMIAFPFTKLMHAVTFAVARYYNGSIQGRKGAES